MSQIRKLGCITLVAIVQQKSADSRSRNERIMIVGREPRTCFVKKHAFKLGKEWSIPIGKMAANDETGSAYSVEVLRALNKIAGTRTPKPSMFYKIAGFAAAIF